MGIVESRVLANNLLTACDQAEKEGKHQLDEAQFWRDTETIRISKSMYKYIPQTIRRTPRQSAIKKAIARSSVQLQVSPVIQGLQDKRESLFPLHSPGRAEGHTGSSANLKLAPLSCHVQPPLQTSSLEYFYNFIIYCEQQQELDKIRLRILYVAFYRLKNAIQPSTQYQYDDNSLFIAHAIRSSGCKDLLPVIVSRVRLWVGRGERYDLIARDLGGLGALYILPEDGGESLWTKELPKSARNPNRIAMIKGLCEQGLPEEAERRGLHILAEDEIAKVLGPTKAALDQVIETHLSAASFQVPRDDRRPRGTGDNWLQSRLPQSCQASFGTPGAPVPQQGAANVDSLYGGINNGQASSTEMVQGVRQLPYEPAVTQVALPKSVGSYGNSGPGAHTWTWGYANSTDTL